MHLLRVMFRVVRMRAPIGSNADMRKERFVGRRKFATRGISDVVMTILCISPPVVHIIHARWLLSSTYVHINLLCLHGTLMATSSKRQSGCMSLSSMTLIWHMTVTLPGSVNWTHSIPEMRLILSLMLQSCDGYCPLPKSGYCSWWHYHCATFYWDNTVELLYKDTPEIRTPPLIRTPCMVPAT